MANNNNASLFLQAIKKSLPILGLLFIFSLLWYGRLALDNPNALPIHNVTISTDAKNIPQQELKDVVMQNVHGGFFSLDTLQLQQALMKMPWIKSVAIRREWPSTINIMINERQALARWGKVAVVDQDGMIFFPASDSIPAGLPTLFGPTERLNDVITLYKQLLPLTELISQQIATLTLNDRGSWQLVLQDGLRVMLGRQDMVSRYQRFMSLYPKIIGANSGNALTADLRYPNGVAVKWKGQTPKLVR